ncbi:hypothetical protein BB381_04900 [Campylobacter pinnipediorum subsp. caledonicus]|nr:hypothetical protein BB381_04900 [Campylobacter pinnipediorum subsp. caledonicus]
MTFFSIEFALIFIMFFVTYWMFYKNYKIQNYIILFFNYMLIFSFSPYFTLIVLLHTCFISYFGLFIAYRENKNALFSGLLVTILFLCFFKYYDFIHSDFKSLLFLLKFDFLAKNLDIALPIGISFYTFSSITYLVGIYKKEQEVAEFIPLACYLSFFATLLAGPIAKSNFMIPQFCKTRKFENIDLIITLVILGITKKALIANYLNIQVSAVFSDPHSFNALEIITAVYLYGAWLYCDFSGYVDIVTAMALSIGFYLPINFNMPHIAVNLKDFWKRWHISLSNFIKENIYIPLGGNKNGFLETQINLIIAFALSGIWHGVGINFLIWGLLHGFGIMFLNILQKAKINISEKLPLFSMCITYTFVSITWIFFDRNDFDEAFNILNLMFNNENKIILNDVILFVALCVLFLFYPFLKNLKDILRGFLRATPTILKPFVLAIFFVFIFAIMPDGIPDFIYSSF